MKYKIYLMFLLLGLFAFAGCDSEDEFVNLYDEFPKGGLVRADLNPNSVNVNLFGDLTQTEISFKLTPFDANGTDGDLIEKLDIYGIYASPLAGTISDTTFLSSELNLNDSVKYSMQFLVDTFDDLTDIGDIKGGDNFTFIFETTMLDGRVFNPSNIAPAICSSNNARGTCTFVVPVVCPSDIPLGDYNASCTGFGATTTKVVTLTRSGPLKYAVTDISAGLLGLLIGNPAFEAGGEFEDFCNLVNVPTFSPPGLVPVSQPAGNFGSYDPDTGIITINWNIIGVTSTTTLTPM